MNDYHHILVALDLTDDGPRVLARAADLAGRYDSRLTLLHVVEPLPVEAAGEAILPPTLGIESELYDNATRRLQDFADAAGLAAAQREVVIGYTKREILHLAEDRGADLIVVGSHGRHGLALLLGSTANAVLHGAPCDVLAVRV